MMHVRLSAPCAIVSKCLEEEALQYCADALFSALLDCSNTSTRAPRCPRYKTRRTWKISLYPCLPRSSKPRSLARGPASWTSHAPASDEDSSSCSYIGWPAKHAAICSSDEFSSFLILSIPPEHSGFPGYYKHYLQLA